MTAGCRCLIGDQPGFTDFHVHMRSFLHTRPPGPSAPNRRASIFADGGDISAITRLGASACARQVDPRFTHAAIRPVFAAGFTGVLEAGGAASSGAVDAAREFGIRAAIGPSLTDMWADEPGGVPRRQLDTEAALVSAADFVSAYDMAAEGGIRAVLSCVD